MLLGTDEITILRGSKFYGTWQWVNSTTGDAEDFSGLSATIKIKNIHEDFEDVKNVFKVGVATVEPLDTNSNAFKGRVDIELSKEDTSYFAIPNSENDKHGASDFYGILEILLSTGEVILKAKVRVVESLESDFIDYLVDERSEAIVINAKIDTLLLRYDEYVSTRDNLVDIVIPTALQTYNDNHADKLEIYNDNHTDKLSIINTALNNIDSKVAIATSASTTATTKAGEAASSATTATTKAGEAASSATTATTKATAAATSEANALSYKNSASTSAATATTKAGEAVSSATAAASSATTATTKASAASASAASATTSASAATTKATEAATSASASATSAAEALEYKNQTSTIANASSMVQILYITGA